MLTSYRVMLLCQHRSWYATSIQPILKLPSLMRLVLLGIWSLLLVNHYLELLLAPPLRLLNAVVKTNPIQNLHMLLSRKTQERTSPASSPPTFNKITISQKARQARTFTEAIQFRENQIVSEHLHSLYLVAMRLPTFTIFRLSRLSSK